MIVLDTNVVSELMKSAPEPAVMAWIDAIPGATVFLSAVTQAEILYGVALVPEGKRREGLALAARTAFETYFRGRILPFELRSSRGVRRAGRRAPPGWPTDFTGGRADCRNRAVARCGARHAERAGFRGVRG